MAEFPTRERVLEMVESHAPRKLQSALRDHLAPATALLLNEIDDESIAVGQSKVGGAPDVPTDFVWPKWERKTSGFLRRTIEEKPLGFVAQFNLEEVAPFDLNQELPSDGVLSFFYAMDEQSWGHLDQKGAWQVFYWPRDVKLERRVNTEIQKRNFLSPHAIDFAVEWQCPSSESFQLIDVELDDGEFEQYNETFCENMKALFPDIPKHHLLGYANNAQGDVPLSLSLSLSSEKKQRGETDLEFVQRLQRNEASRWRLLFQLDSYINRADFSKGWIWGDAGMIYFCLREDDLKARRFDDMWLQLQCG